MIDPHIPIADSTVYCPICQRRFPASEYLHTVFPDDIGSEWFSNMVTHYRHAHRAYDRWIRYAERKGVPYEEQKATINQQAKRQILRKCIGYMDIHGIGIDQIAPLLDGEPKTIAVVEKCFGIAVLSFDFDGCQYGAKELDVACPLCSAEKCRARWLAGT